MNTLKKLYEDGCAQLLSAGIENADFEALQILLYAAGLTHTEYLLTRAAQPSRQIEKKYLDLIRRRSENEPLQYLLNSEWFLDRAFTVGPGVLIPRPETQVLTRLCINQIKACGYQTVYDLCAGSGCIGISIALACPETRVYLFEKYDAAIAYMKKNIPEEAADRILIVQTDVFSGPADGIPAPEMIVSNPPYISSVEMPYLQPEVRKEPASALDGGADGLDFYHAISLLWMPLLAQHGFAAFECGEGQPQAVCGIMKSHGNVRVHEDQFHVERFVTVKK